jgi:hypothetical protein
VNRIVYLNEIIVIFLTCSKNKKNPATFLCENIFMKLSLFIIVNMLFYISCKPTDNRKITDNSDYKIRNSDRKPFHNILNKIEIKRLDAGKGTTLIFESGSKMEIPSDAFSHQNGDLVKGAIDIHFIEYSDVIDRFISGIPLTYDTLGQTFLFESAAMCSVFGYQNGEPIFIQDSKAPTVFLSSSKSDKSYNVYHFDTIKNIWNPEGRSAIVDRNPLSNTTKKQKKIKEIENDEILIKPRKADPAKITLSVSIPYVDAFPELSVFKNTKFEVYDPDNLYNSKDGDILWDKVALEQTEKIGWYKLLFTKGKRRVIYDVQPCLKEVIMKMH